MKSIIIRSKHEVIKVMLSDVCYIISHPTKPHYIQVITEEDEYDLLQKLQEIETMFAEDLVRCHRNCLVNTSKIISINFEKKIISLGERGQYRVRFSRRRYQKILQKWVKQGES